MFKIIIEQCFARIKNFVVNEIPPKTLGQLSSYELFNELQGEICNIIKKGAFDSIKLLNDLSSEQDEALTPAQMM